MGTRRIAIIGGGLAAASAAETLRAEGYDGAVTIVGAERHLPYLRPPLSKEYLKDPEAAPLSTYVHPFEWYPDQGIDVITGTLAVELDPNEKEIVLDDRSTLNYDRALIATGAAPRRLNVPGADASGVHLLRTLEDSEELREAIAGGGRRVLVVGSGWIGLEAAAAARGYGNEVTVVGRGEVPLAGAVGPELGAFYGRVHREHGVEFRMRRGIRRLTVADGRVSGVETDHDGEMIAADLVLVGIGAAPNTELAQDARIAVDNGVLVDEQLRSSAPEVYAAGDVANAMHPVLGHRLRSEHWANALNGGSTAAKAMLGQDVVFDAVPYFYSDQYETGMEYAGYPSLAADSAPVYRGEPDSGEFIAFWTSGGRLVAGMNVNVWDVSDDIQSVIRSGRAVDPARLADPSVPILEL